MTPEMIKLLQDTSSRQPKDLQLTEVPQSLYEQAYEFLMNKYGGAIGRTNLMINGHLITPKLEEAFRVRDMLVQAARAKQARDITVPPKLEQK